MRYIEIKEAKRVGAVNVAATTEEGEGENKFFKRIPKQNELKLKKHHIGLVNDIANSELAAISMDRKLQKLTNFEGIE